MKAQDLKKSILQLAIQGKLVAQDKNDEPAEVLYAKIQAEKQKLIKEGKIKKDKPLPPITEDEIPFPIPPTWKWVRLGDCIDVRDGTHDSPKYVKNGIPLVTSKCLSSGVLDISKANLISIEDANKINERSKVNVKDILFAMIGSIGNPIIVSQEPNFCIKNMALFKNNKNIDEKFLFIFSLYAQNEMRKIAQGAVQSFVSLSFIRNFLFPLPPLDEQKRIVARIEELEPLINQYDQAEQELSTLNDKFPEQLKKSILQYAIQGKLVAQDENDEPAEVLYTKIQAEKQKLIKEGKIKKDKPLPPITEDEIPFSIPPTWKWVRLGEIVKYIQRGKSPEYTDIKKVPVISQKCNQWNGLDISSVKFITERSLYNYNQERYLLTNDLLLNSTGTGTVGRVGIYYENLNPYHIAVADSHVTVVRPLWVSSKYLYNFFASPYIQLNIENLCDGSTNQIELALQTVKKILIPLPPLEEQHRIVAKVNNLLDACGRLSNPLTYKTQENKSPITNEWLIDKGFELCSQKGYTDIDEILRELDIDLLLDRRLNKGRIEFVDGRFRIWVADLNDNWTKTHEVVHYVNDNKEIQLYGAVGRKDETSLPKAKEINVDAITAEILMPENIFISALEVERVKKYALVDNSVIRKLRKLFRVSDYAVKVRLQNLGYHTK